MNRNWWQKEVAYQIYPRSFSDSNNDGIGDLQGIIQKMDYLENLGITLIWLSPMYPSPMADNGYDISDYYGISSDFGTMADFDELIEEAKKRNIKVILDLVVNHTSDEHAWFQDVLKNPQSRFRDFYIIKEGREVPTNWRSNFGGSVWEKLPGEDAYYFHAFHKKQPDLNWENPELRKEIYQMIRFWLNKGIAGFRVDAINFIKKDLTWTNLPADGADQLAKVTKASRNMPGMSDFLNELKEKAFAGFDIVTVAEAAGVNYPNLSEFIGETGYFDMIFDFKWADLNVKSGSEWFYRIDWSWNDLRTLIFKQQEAMQEAGWSANFIENHDQPRATTKYLKEQAQQPNAVKTFGAMYFFLRGTPFIYQGQELGMTNFERGSIDEFDDISSIDQYYRAIKEGFTPKEALSLVNLRSRDNARTPFPWNDSMYGGFSSVKPWLGMVDNYKEINAEAEIKNSQSIFHFYKRMIAFRQKSPYTDILLYGTFEGLSNLPDNVIAYKRKLNEKTIYAFFNFGEAVPIPHYLVNGTVIFDTQSEEREQLVQQGTLLKSYQGLLITINE
ncbi:glycoside hydrolase family 13 protein [Enterococcus faecalis]|uniref:glycoside hydrolase family 13 protein n=1 Tax=Enterococcus faecalis TaxID=1351 RepID=UPI0022E8CC85|nr:alpha-glucosidase [Enterococcus faecalis]